VRWIALVKKVIWEGDRGGDLDLGRGDGCMRGLSGLSGLYG